jgi:hypothetical protein
MYIKCPHRRFLVARIVHRLMHYCTYSNDNNNGRPSPAPISIQQPPKLPTVLPTTTPLQPTFTDILLVAAPVTAPTTTSRTTAGSNIILEPEETTTIVFKHWIMYSILGSLVLTAVISSCMIRRRIHKKRLCWIKKL